MRLPGLNLQTLLAAVCGIGLGLLFQSLGPDSSTVVTGLYVSDIVGKLIDAEPAISGRAA